MFGLGCLWFGLFSCFSFPDWLRIGSGDVGHQEEGASTEGQEASAEEQDDPEASASERDHDDPEAQGMSEYGVFLSFRGPDSRQGLADVIYSDMTTAGIRVFRDSDVLEMGDEISKILPAIESSMICVPIFSETFAASPWCLREVEAMVDLEKTIMPVFYTASPDDVKLRTELFKKDLGKHEKKHGKEQVKKWEDSLKAVGKIIGREVKTTGFAEFSKLLVRALLMKLKAKKKLVTNFLVKRGNQEAAVMKLLDIGSCGVRLVGIHGMCGIGKTTLVKVIFDELSAKFDCCSFLENVHESLRCNGIEFLKRKLLEDLDPKLKVFPMIDSRMVLQNSFRHRKVLIILDDVNERKQVEMIVGVLKWFGSGSRIIVTTKDKRVFTKEAHTFEVQWMNQDQALQLFSKHAFGADSPPSDYQTLSNEVVRLTGQLPLALEVIGDLLQGCQKRMWEDTIVRLKTIPNRSVREKLKLSFDALEYEHKQIFLDIACFFINKETSNARYMWEACGLFPKEGIEVLVSMSLLKIQENRFWMHDLIRDLGRALVKEECPNEPAQRSRIWSREEASEVLKMKEGKETVEGLFLERLGGGANLTNEQFSGFGRLRLLKLVGAKLEGNFELLLPKLKWFSWHRCPSDFTMTNISLDKLVILDLSWSSINENWPGWSMIQMAKNLKVLDVTGCCSLTTTPDLSNNTALERLILKGCSRLADIHCSIAELRRLKHLDLEGCSSLRGLPDEFGSLEDLEVISVVGDGNSFQLPKSIGKMRSLSIIKLHRVGITRVPDSIGGLENLVRLSMRECTGLKELPDSVGDLKSLVYLNLSETNLRALPNSIGRLVKLQSLNLESTKLGELPDAIGDLQSLVELMLQYTEVSVLPNSVGRLAKLQRLNLEDSKVKELPGSLGDMSEMRRLWLERSEIRELPSCIGQLTNLVELQVGSSGFTTEIPEEIGSLSALTSLSLSGQVVNDELNCIPQLPSTLEVLTLSNFTAETRLPDFSNLENLMEIEFSDCCLPSNAENLRVLTVPRSLRLRQLTVGSSNELDEIRGLEELESLVTLDILGCGSLKRVGNLSESTSHLRIENCPKLEEIDKGADIDRLVFQAIYIDNCPALNCDKLKKRCLEGVFEEIVVENNIGPVE